jgi:hypothetical protein
MTGCKFFLIPLRAAERLCRGGVVIRTKGAYAIGGLALPVLLSTCIVRAGRQNHRLQPTVARIPRMEGLSRRVRQHDQPVRPDAWGE